jgi:hypothetical protein
MDTEQLNQRIDAACGRIAPLWPLGGAVISNTNLQITGNFGSEYPTGEKGWTGE